MKNIFFIILLILIDGCDLVSVKKETERDELPIASVNEVNLYKKDIVSMIPENLSKQDSIVLVKSLINSWAKQQLFLERAQENISTVSSENIEDLVNSYRKSLYINGYKERLIKQRLDTIVTEEEVHTYYQNNKENFKLNEGLVQFDYVHFGDKFLDKKEMIKQFKSSKEDDKFSIEEKSISFKSFRLNDSTWVSIDYLKEKIPPLRVEPKERLLKISKYIQKEDSLGVYLVAVKNVLRKAQIAPLSYVTSRVKQIILHKRRIELIREIEKTLVNDAIQNKNFKEY